MAHRKARFIGNDGFSSPQTDTSMQARIGARIEPQPNGCWLYNGATRRGHAYIDRNHRIMAHRYVYEILTGPLNDDECERTTQLVPVDDIAAGFTTSCDAPDCLPA